MSSERVRKLLAEAAKLPVNERAELVEELVRTLPEVFEQDELNFDEASLGWDAAGWEEYAAKQ